MSHYVALAGLALTVYTRWTSRDLPASAYARIRGMLPHAQPYFSSQNLVSLKLTTFLKSLWLWTEKPQ